MLLLSVWFSGFQAAAVFWWAGGRQLFRLCAAGTYYCTKNVSDCTYDVSVKALSARCSSNPFGALPEEKEDLPTVAWC
jgi:hypothetical protein